MDVCVYAHQTQLSIDNLINGPFCKRSQFQTSVCLFVKGRLSTEQNWKGKTKENCNLALTPKLRTLLLGGLDYLLLHTQYVFTIQARSLLGVLRGL